MELLQNLLALCQEYDVYKEMAIYYDCKLEDLDGRNITPADNLILSNIANTLENQINSKKITESSNTDTSLIYRMAGDFKQEKQNNTTSNPLPNIHSQQFLYHFALSNLMRSVRCVIIRDIIVIPDLFLHNIIGL